MANIAESNPEIRAVLLAVQKRLTAAVGSGRGFVAFENINYGDGHLAIAKWKLPAIYEVLDESKLSC